MKTDKGKKRGGGPGTLGKKKGGREKARGTRRKGGSEGRKKSWLQPVI